uniref:Putative cyclic nucleotide gated channel 1 n=1 Tax=Linum usitatissimum TaxID=4006 RepID=A0A172MLI3_LINUS|nr:putative cyclic nucleotide gated channel 1 [Linum usitatissimum]
MKATGGGWWIWRTFRRREKAIRRWNLVFLVLCGVALLVDPLFLYIPRIQKRRNQYYCIGFDTKLAAVATLVRSAVDALYLIRIHFHLRTAFVAPPSTVSGAVQVVVDSSAIARRYLYSLFFPVDLLSLLPFPQVLVLVAWMLKEARGAEIMTTITVLQAGVFLQWVPRVLRMYQLNQEVIKTSFAINRGAIARTFMTIFLYIAAANVTSAFWYSLSVRQQMDCWRAACGRNHSTDRCDYNAVVTTCWYDGNPRMDYAAASVILDRSCPKGDSNGGVGTHFNYGMFADAINSGILESSHFHKKFLFCFWWALQSLSTFGQNIKPSDNSWEICFAICIFVFGLLLFSLVIAVIQTRMLTTTIRMEEMKMKWEDVDQWMTAHFIPHELKRRVRRHEEYRWRRHQGIDFHNLVRSLPKDLRRDINHNLCFSLITKVPMLEKLEERRKEELCDRLRPVLYTEGSCIIREGDPLDEMIFILRGKVRLSSGDDQLGGDEVFLNNENFYGEELLIWASSSHHGLLPSSSSSPTHTMRIPVSSKTCTTVTEVEAFVLSAADLRSCIHNNVVSSQLGLYEKDPIRWKSI